MSGPADPAAQRRDDFEPTENRTDPEQVERPASPAPAEDPTEDTSDWSDPRVGEA
ncbi:MAG TPA: hypothetical protein VHK06_04075 [Candidatus Limnocylindria bacterium]|nr:hypothetical protein [Candidatus Limnocylindria bacterium]